MITPELSAIILHVTSLVVPLVAGYLLRHYGVSLPLLPSATPAVPASPSPVVTVAAVPAAVVPAATAAPVAVTPAATPVGLLQQVLGIGEAEAAALLQQAVNSTIVTKLSTPSTPKA